MLNLEGEVTEGSGDNIFFVKDGVLYTPPVEVGILSGITRRFVMQELCPAEDLRCEEKRFGIDELLEADEVFMTGSAAEIIAVTRIDDTTIGTGAEGPITNRLRSRFRRIVTSDPIPEN